jgi:predicted XRE-type DNA-binding protein
MLSVVPKEPPKRGDALTLPTLDQAELRRITDPWRRSQLADALVKQLAMLSSAALRIRSEAIRELIKQHRTSQARIARHLGMSRTRVGQLVTASCRDDVDHSHATNHTDELVRAGVGQLLAGPRRRRSARPDVDDGAGS